MPRIIRVLIVDDSALIRQMLTRALSMDPRVQIVGTAKTGVEAIEQAKALLPDVITLDIEMPELSGLEALPHILAHTEARVVMLSSLDDPETTYRALSLGAIDFIAKPSAGVASSITELCESLLKTIKTANRISPDRAAAARAALSDPIGSREASGSETGVSAAGTMAACVGITSSTGGPPALERVLQGLPATLPASYVIVQHLPAGFSASLARRLRAVGEIDVVEAEDGMLLESGKAFVAPHGVHVIVERDVEHGRLRFVDHAAIHGVRPAGDYLLKSIADAYGSSGIGVVLTGMGADGAEGALCIRQAGGDTILQDEATSVVWGMPGSALRAGAASRVVPVGLVAAEIRRAVRSMAQRRRSA